MGTDGSDFYSRIDRFVQGVDFDGTMTGAKYFDNGELIINQIVVADQNGNRGI